MTHASLSLPQPASAYLNMLGYRPREATRLLFTQMCVLKSADCTHNGRDPKYQTYPLMGRCPPKSRPIMAIQTGCFTF